MARFCAFSVIERIYFVTADALPVSFVGAIEQCWRRRRDVDHITLGETLEHATAG